MPTIAVYAKLNKLHYRMSDGNKKDKQKAIEKAGKLGYDVGSHKRGVAHFRSRDPDDIHNIVTIKGTNPKNKKDLVSDIHLAVGISSKDKQFQRRTNEIKKIYSTIGADETKYLSGHSLGGSVVSHAMVKSKSIRDATKSAHTYNPGYTPAFHSELSKDLSKQDKKELKSKLIHHHNKGDLVSASLAMDAVGKVMVSSGKASSAHSLDNFHSEKKLKDAPEEVPEYGTPSGAP